MTIRALSLVALSLALAACGSGMGDLDQYAADVKSRRYGQLLRSA